nr:hypothetical protein [Gemmatimonadota bacterium]
EYAAGLLTPSLTLVGQKDWIGRAIRGNEELGELRAGVRAGRRRWVEVDAVVGFAEFSPSAGVRVSAGVSR